MRGKIFLGTLALAAVLLAGCGGGSAEKQPEQSTASASQGEAVQFEGTDLEGNPVTSDLFSQSKLTMVNVYALEDVQIIGIVSDVLEGEDQELAESLVEETQANYPHLLLNESIFYGLLTDVAAVPTTFFIDGEGVVLDTVVGARDKSAWEEMIHGFLEAD